MLPLRTVVKLLLLVAASSNRVSFAADEKPDDPCTVRSVNSGAFYDLNTLSAHRLKEGETKRKSDIVEDWAARGWDYGTNFTINICSPVIKQLDEVVGISKSAYQNVSAYYTKDDLVYSMGQVSNALHFRGRKLVLQYTDGSPCATSGSSRHSTMKAPERRKSGSDDDEKDGDDGSVPDDDDDDDDGDGDDSPTSSTTTTSSARTTSTSRPKATLAPTTRRKSTTISFLCDRDPDAPKAAFSFVGTDPDECAYFFETRTAAACGGIARDKEQGVSPGGVFGIIALIALLVYILGGCVYQRTVMHQRGWRQLPNYGLWAGIAGFIRDFFIIVGSMIGRCVPNPFGSRRKGYSHLSISADDRRSDARRREDDENRLIDQLDEHWDD